MNTDQFVQKLIADALRGPGFPPRTFPARNGLRIRTYAAQEDARDCERGYEHHPKPLPWSASDAFRDGWYDRESYVNDNTPEES